MAKGNPGCKFGLFIDRKVVNNYGNYKFVKY